MVNYSLHKFVKLQITCKIIKIYLCVYPCAPMWGSLLGNIEKPESVTDFALLHVKLH